MLVALSMKDGTFQLIDGNLILNDFVGVKVGPGDWRVIDLKSGALVKGGLRSLSKCKEFVHDIPDPYRSKLEDFKKSTRYKTLSEQVHKVLTEAYGR